MEFRSPDGLDALRGELKEVIESQPDAVVAVGGDGSYHALLGGLRGSGIPLGVIPRGTANDLASSHGVPMSVEDACTIIRVGASRKLDLVVVNGVPFATVGGLGIAADVAVGVNRLRERLWFRILMRVLGHRTYTLVSVLKLLFKWRIQYDLSIEVDGRPLPVSACAVFVNNQARLGKSLETVPTADNVDGIFDVCVIKSCRKIRMLRIFAKLMAGTHLDVPEVETISVSKLTVRAERPFVFFADGEFLGDQKECHIRVSRGALRLLMPRNLAEQRPEGIDASWGSWSGVFGGSSAEFPAYRDPVVRPSRRLPPPRR